LRLTKWKKWDACLIMLRYIPCFSIHHLWQNDTTSTPFCGFLGSISRCCFLMYYLRIVFAPSWTPFPCSKPKYDQNILPSCGNCLWSSVLNRYLHWKFLYKKVNPLCYKLYHIFPSNIYGLHDT
jgi:hypothetical protein